MSGERDLARLLASLTATAREGEYAFVARPAPDPALAALAHGMVREDEGITYVLPCEVADTRGLPYDFRAAWLTLGVHSALDAVGLTAAFATALARHGIPCNVLAGFHHDHLLVAADRRDDALAVLAGLARDGGGA
ncbi:MULTISPECIES: ACT domain-containing protein [unclassified Lysobacter]|uniref:ACT domain-containing protein n=1 Tax=unclassified Lysobacter TaxID=2635362 RepID=UPI001C24CF7B|nr:ACT domain-containing protein [Lysobacter sp. MMG2]MBU8977250.1 ACT domain-containing protein [Lysobacter sp. MMG2]